MSTAIQAYEVGGSYLTQWREPEEVLAEAQKAATALKKVVSMKKSPVMFNGEQYLEREDWGTVAKFYGCTAKSTETRYVEYGNVRGFEAVAIVIDRNGNEIGRAESMCLNDEENWGAVPKYDWQDKLDGEGKKIWDPKLRDGKGGYVREKVKIGETQKPLFQLRSMAQTRAEAKALKGVFSWVVVLAGYRPTPAEEMTGNESFEEQPQETRQPVTQPQRASEKAAQQAQPQTNGQPQVEVIEGIIEGIKAQQNGAIWLSLKSNHLVFVPSANVDADMVVGNFIRLRGVKFKKEKIGDYYELKALIELSQVQDGAPAEAPAEAPLDPAMKAVGDELFGAQEGKAAVQQMVDNGSVTTASQIPAGDGKKKIGRNRAQRIYTLCGVNKAQNNGFSEAIIKRILAEWEPPLEHLSDLTVEDYPQFEAWATGEADWRTVWASAAEAK